MSAMRGAFCTTLLLSALGSDPISPGIRAATVPIALLFWYLITAIHDVWALYQFSFTATAHYENIEYAYASAKIRCKFLFHQR